MAEYQQVVYEIQSLLALPEVAPSESQRVHRLAQQYSDAVNEVNARLRECDEFLRRGNRDEAVRRSKAEPDLLEAAGTLDFLERQQWNELLDHFQVARPPNLQTEIAEELNASFASVQSDARLMRLHRLYALARRPLRERISVMRQIARARPDEPFWQEDLVTFEKARHEEVPLEIDAAARSGDMKCLARLDQELRSEDWRERPPAALIQRAGQLHKQMRVAAARRELERLADTLNQAHSALDAAAGRQARDAFNHLAPQGISNPGDPLLELVAPAMQWLAEEDRREQEQAEYEAALRTLEKAINSPRVIPHKLERLYHAVAQHDAGVPERLQRLYEERRRQLAAQEARRKRLRVLAALLVVAGLAAATWYVAHRRAFLAEVQRHKEALAALLDEKKLDEAGQYVEGLKEGAPAVHRAQDIQELCARLAAGMEAEGQRQRDLEQHLAAAKQWGVDEADWETFPGALEEIEKALAIAKPAEQARVEALKQQIEDQQRRLQQRVDRQFADDWKALEGRIKNVDRNSSDEITQRLAEIQEMERRAHVSAELLIPLPAAVERLKKLNAELAQRQTEKQILDTITKALGDPERFAIALGRYREKLPNTSRAEDFASVAQQEVSIWKGVKRWDDLLDRWARVSMTGLSPQRAGEMVAEADRLSQELSDSGAPIPAEVGFLLPHLKAIAERGADGGPGTVADLEERLKLPAVADLMMVKTTAAAGGERYYFQQKPIDTGSRLSFVYFKTIDLKEMERVRLAKSDIANPVANDVYDWTSPQARFSAFARDKLAEIQLDNWERTFYEILQSLAADQEIEPILKAQLMQMVLDTACKGSHCFQQAFRKHLDALEGARLDPNANWLVPRDDAAEKARRAAREALQRLPDLATAGAEAASLYKQLAKGVAGPRYAWVGWLCDEGGGNWTCVTNPDGLPKLSGKLVVIFRPSESGPTSQAEVGTFDRQEARLAPGAKDGLKEGRPVFLYRDEAR